MPIDKINLPEEFIVPDSDKKFYEKIGNKIRDIRIAQKISQEQLANMLGINSEFIDAYETATLAVPIYHFIEIGKKHNRLEEFDKIIKQNG